jgi:diguanylate cyclase (GGDEF)-like protein/PAS domain S-box-containing protein
MTDENTNNNAATSEALLLDRFEIHREFTKVFLDAFILINPKRKVIKFNQAFCTMLGVRAVDVKKSESIDSLIRTQIPGSLKDVIDLILEATSVQRVDEVQAFRQHDGSFIQLIVSSFPYTDNDGNLLGTCALLRDVTAETNLQGKYQEKAIQSITDPLSGLFTRRYFEEWIDKEMERNKRNNTAPAIGLLMFDLDKFKNINDTFGHQAGDYVIATTAKLLKDSARKSDIIGRYGGEELLVLLVSTTPRGTCAAAEKFRKAIQEYEYVHDGKRIPVTASVGASFFLSPNDSRVDVVKRADECLYHAKRGGRNVCFCDFNGQPLKAEDYLKNTPEVPSKEEKQTEI